MRLPYAAVAVLACGVAWAQAPAYTAAGIVNASDFSPGPFAPNSILSVFGTNLARSSQALTADNVHGGYLPTELNYTRVYVDNYPVPLLYVSEGQINFLVPSNQSPGNSLIRVVREGFTGPDVTVPVVDAAPALFMTPGNYALATHADNSLVTPDAPAHADEIIVVWATGLGKTVPPTDPQNTGEIPRTAATIAQLPNLKVTLAGAVLEPALIKYAGITPQSAGLYQINLAVPGSAGADPEIRVAIGNQSTPAGVKLAVRQPPPQPESSEPR